MGTVTLSSGDVVELRDSDASDFLFITSAAAHEKEPTLTYKAIARLVVSWGEEEVFKSMKHDAIANLGRRDIRALKQAVSIFDSSEASYEPLDARELEDGGLEIKLSNGEVLTLRDSTGKDERSAGEFASVRNAAGKTERNDYRYILYLFGLLSGYEGRDRFQEFCAIVPFQDCVQLTQVYNHFF